LHLSASFIYRNLFFKDLCLCFDGMLNTVIDLYCKLWLT